MTQNGRTQTAERNNRWSPLGEKTRRGGRWSQPPPPMQTRKRAMAVGVSKRGKQWKQAHIRSVQKQKSKLKRVRVA